MDKCWFVLRQTHFLAPQYLNQDVARGEASGSLLLGHIIPDLTRLDQVINHEGPRPFPPQEIQVEQTSLCDFQWETSKESGSRGGLELAMPIASAAGVTVQTGLHVEFKRTVGDSWQFDRLDTQIIRPTTHYIKQSLKSPQVSEYIDSAKHLGFYRLFMISGLMIARGASLGRTDSKGGSANVEPGLNVAEIAGASIHAGASRSTQSTLSARQMNDFIWAVRLTEISKHAFRSDIKHKTYIKGATLSSCDTVLNIKEMAEGSGLKEYDAMELQGSDAQQTVYLIIPVQS